MAIASLVFGILSIIVAVIGLFTYSAVSVIGMLVGVLALTLSAVSKNNPKESERLAKAGLTCGVVGISVSVIAIVIAIIYMSNAAFCVAETLVTRIMSYLQ